MKNKGRYGESVRIRQDLVDAARAIANREGRFVRHVIESALDKSPLANTLAGKPAEKKTRQNGGRASR